MRIFRWIFLLLLFLTEAEAGFVWREGKISVGKDLIKKIPLEGGLKIMWWNTDCTPRGRHRRTREYPNHNPDFLFKNLQHLVESPWKPDILILGESCPPEFDHQTYLSLMQAYDAKNNPNHKIDLYRTMKLNDDLYRWTQERKKDDDEIGRACKGGGVNTVIRNGIRIFSQQDYQYEFDIVSGREFSKTELLKNCTNRMMTWADLIKRRKNKNRACEQAALDDLMLKAEPDWDKKSMPKKNYLPGAWDRRFVRMHIQNLEFDFKLFAVHLAQPWETILRCSDQKRRLLDEITKYDNDIQNPNTSQVIELIEKARLLREKGHEVLVIGDFNAPKKILVPHTGGILSMDGAGYGLLKEFFGGSRIENGISTYVHPTNHFKSVVIDHAFASSGIQVTYGQVLPLAGADHLPLYVVVE